MTTGTMELDTDKLFTARLLAVRARPYLATALYALHLLESHAVPTMGVDRYWRCYVSPAFVNCTPVEELASILVHEVSHLLREHHRRSDRFAREHDLAGPAERLRMNIAADAEINDDAFGEGLVQPEGAVMPQTLGLPTGELMEDYLRRFRLGHNTQDFAWLDCGSGADGLDREWDLGPDGADGLSEQEREAVRFRVAQGIAGHPGDAPRGWRRWAEEALHPPQPWRDLLRAAIRAAASAPASATTTRTVGPRAARPGYPVSSCRACGTRRPGSASSSTPRARSATPSWAVRSWKPRPSPAPSAVAATCSPCCPVTRRHGSRIRCAAPTGYR
ncbi:hypothetical protein ABIA39_004846 [Nocardia sp. GAS34]